VTRKVIRLKVKELMKAQIEANISTDSALAKVIGVSVSQIWRAKLPVTDARYNAPGSQFIAGVIGAFQGRFEDFFYVDEVS
jgi:hypothetical protein